MYGTVFKNNASPWRGIMIENLYNECERMIVAFATNMRLNIEGVIINSLSRSHRLKKPLQFGL